MTTRTAALLIGACLLPSATARADAKSRVAAELAESMIAKFGSKAGTSAASLTARIETFAARHGEGALLALRKVGPEAFGLVEAAGVNGTKAASLLARHGEAGASLVLRRPAAMRQFVRFGEEAASVLVKHPGVAEGVVEKGGVFAVRALSAVTPQNGRRLAMLFDGELAAVARKPELLDVIGKYGDRAARFVWENKGALAVGTTLAAFVADPEPFLSGARDVTRIAAESVGRPVAEAVAASVNWTLVVLIVLAPVAVVILWRFAPWKKVATFPAAPDEPLPR